MNGDIPKNAQKLADDANAAGWHATITTGRGALLNTEAPEGFDAVESVAVRLRSPGDHVRAYGVWMKKDRDDGFGYKNGAVLWRRGCMPDGAQQGKRGYRELISLVAG